jgi:hypothetical protein
MNAIAYNLEAETINYDEPASELLQALAAEELAMIGGGVAVINSI